METQDCMDFAEFFAEISLRAFASGDVEVGESFKREAQQWAKFAQLD